jgi:hypothetical protein
MSEWPGNGPQPPKPGTDPNDPNRQPPTDAVEAPTHNVYDKEHPLYDAQGWAVFYANQAKTYQHDPAMAQVFQASCETSDLLLELVSTREKLYILSAKLRNESPAEPRQ